MSGGRIQEKVHLWGHGVDYFTKNRLQAPTEIFADFYALYSGGKTDEIALLRSFYPGTIAALEKTIRKLTGG